MPRHWRWNVGADPTPRPAVVFDIDGVLADASGRDHYVARQPKDWDSFFAACGEDPPIEAGTSAVAAVPNEVALVLLTGRPLKVQKATVDWCAQHSIRWDLLIMRAAGQYSASAAFKGQEFDRLAGTGFDVLAVFDDDASVIDQARARGLPATLVARE